MIKSLPQKRFEGFLCLLAQEQHGAVLAELARHLRETQGVSETEINQRFSLGRSQFRQRMEAMGKSLLSCRGDVLSDSLYQVAKDLFDAVQYDAATDLIKAGLKAAVDIEDFPLVIRFLEVMDSMPTPPIIETMTAAEARRLRNNLNAYDDLWALFLVHIQQTNVLLKRKALAKMMEDRLLQDPSHALSQRAVYYYWKIRASCYIHMREHLKALACEEALLAHLETFPWVCLDFEYNKAKETNILGQLLRATGQKVRFEALNAAFERMIFKSLRAAQERAFLRFPASIAFALEQGERQNMIDAIHEFLALHEARKIPFASPYITENLCFCLYGALADKNHGLWIKVSQHLNGFGKPEFKPKYYALFCFLQVIRALEAHDWEEAIRRVKNFRASSAIEEFQGMREVVGFLSATIGLWSQDAGANRFRFDETATAKLYAAIQDVELLDYFDLPAWMEAWEKGCPMIEIFHHREHAERS